MACSPKSCKAAKLQSQCSISPDDVIVSIVENDDADWSFGRGRAQFITRELT
nr:tautomerase family protein [Paraburkholderia guartelaensis]